MNLRAIANGATAAVNPNTAALLRLPDKYRTDDPAGAAQIGSKRIHPSKRQPEKRNPAP